MSDSRLIAELSLSHPEIVLAPTIEAVPEVTTELEYQTFAEPDSYYLFFTATGDSFDRFDRALADDPTVTDVTISIAAEGFRVYRMRLTSAKRLVLPMAAELGMRVLHATSGNHGWHATLEVPELEALEAFRDHCRDREVTFSLDRLYHATESATGGEYGLTAIQRETLIAAYEHGYFNDPRDASVDDLATVLDVSSSAVSGRLRRAMAALLEHTLVEPPNRL